jgi:ferric-dicitrate binding protein FerR (iron transport regulator)
MDANILRRYFANKYSRKDFFSISSAIHQKERNFHLEKQMKAYWMDFDEDELPDVQLNYILDKVQHRIYLDENRKRKKKVISFWQLAQRIAAILFVPLLIGSVIYNNWYPTNKQTPTSWAEIQCPLGVRTKFHLPDGSTGYLNSGSILRYPVSFEKNRNVVLSGEGFFNIKHDKNLPFHVETKNLDIKVLGTSFNVVAFDNEKSEEIILQTGHVDVSDHNGNKMASLTPEQRFVLERENMKFNLGKVVSEQYTTWKDGKLMFRNEGIEDVAVRLGRWYNAEILIDHTDARISAYTFHGTFIDEQLEDVLKVISMSSPISYKEFARESDKNGTYSKRRIILSINPNKIKEFE